MKETIVIERPRPELVKVRLNRPEIGNTYDDEFVCTLITAFDELAEDENIKLVWLTSAGEHFCKGPDGAWQKKRLLAGKAEHQQDAEQLSRLFHTLYEFPIPILATVRGQTNSAGVGILCCCDMVMACERSSFTIMETQYGQVPAIQSPYLIKALGERAASYYSLSGETMDAYTATRLGLVNRIVPRNELDAMADMLANKMLKRSNISLRQTKAVLHLSANEPFDDSLVDTLIDCSTDIRVSQAKAGEKQTA